MHEVLRLWEGRILDDPMEIEKEILIGRSEMHVWLVERLPVMFFEF